MRLLLPSLVCAGAAFAAPSPRADKPLPEQTRELLVGKWEDPKLPGNTLQFDKDGAFTSSISAGAIKAHPSGTWRVLEDGSLQRTVKFRDQAAPARKYRVKVSREKLILIDKQNREAMYRRAR